MNSLRLQVTYKERFLCQKNALNGTDDLVSVNNVTWE